MLHHVSFAARDPSRVAEVLAKMLGAYAMRAPSPPFPQGTSFVVFGDRHGSLIELLPEGNVLDRHTPGGFRQVEQLPLPTASHALLSTSHSTAFVLDLAAQEKWPASVVDAGLFQFVKIWVEGSLVIELLTPEHMAAYVGTFGADGIASLDAELRGLEQRIAAKRPQ